MTRWERVLSVALLALLVLLSVAAAVGAVESARETRGKRCTAQSWEWVGKAYLPVCVQWAPNR